MVKQVPGEDWPEEGSHPYSMRSSAMGTPPISSPGFWSWVASLPQDGGQGLNWLQMAITPFPTAHWDTGEGT